MLEWHHVLSWAQETCRQSALGYSITLSFLWFPIIVLSRTHICFTLFASPIPWRQLSERQREAASRPGSHPLGSGLSKAAHPHHCSQHRSWGSQPWEFSPLGLGKQDWSRREQACSLLAPAAEHRRRSDAVSGASVKNAR